MVSNIVYFQPYLGKSSNLTNIFSSGLKPPTTRGFKNTHYIMISHYKDSNIKGGARVYPQCKELIDAVHIWVGGRINHRMVFNEYVYR